MLGIVGAVAGVNLGEHPGHVVGQGTHGLHALGVERSLAFGATGTFKLDSLPSSH